MSETKNNQQKYGMGYSETFVNFLKKRRVETHAQFLLPYLKPGLKILDCGCGPGSMTIGFARCSENGEVIGIDIEDSQLEIAREDARKAGVTNVTFQHASVLELPFADNTFDIVFSQGLISHFSNPLAVVLEQKRVVKAGGIVAAHNGYMSGAAFYPTNAILEEAYDLSKQPSIAHGGDPDIGIKLGKLFADAGFIDIKHTIFCDTNDIKEMAYFCADEVLQREYNKKLLTQGKITLEKLQSYRDAWLDFAKTPHAFSYFPWGEVIGFKSI